MIGDEAQTLIDEYRTGGDRELREAIAEREMSHSPTRMLYAVFAPDGRKLYGALETEPADAWACTTSCSSTRAKDPIRRGRWRSTSRRTSGWSSPPTANGSSGSTRP